MHFLDRSKFPAPACISPHDPARKYKDLPTVARNSIRDQLHKMQEKRCAYCERRTGTGPKDGHIEHFRDQATHTKLTTKWENLFWSCSDPQFCGIHKDTCNIVGGTGKCRDFDPKNILDPSVDYPDHFMLFISDGTINKRENLTEDQQRRFDETLRVFQLADAAFLVDSRKDAVKPYIDALDELKSYGPTVVRAYINRQLVRISGVPFETAVRHFLESYAP